MSGYNPKYPEDMYNKEHKLLFFRYSLAVERALEHYKEIVHGTFRENPRWPCGIEVSKLPSIVSYLPTATRRKVLNHGGPLRERTQSLHSDISESYQEKTDVETHNRTDSPFIGNTGFYDQWSDIEDPDQMSSALGAVAKRRLKTNRSLIKESRNSAAESKQSHRERSKNKGEKLNNQNFVSQKPSFASYCPQMSKMRTSSSRYSPQRKINSLLSRSLPGNLASNHLIKHMVKEPSLINTRYHGNQDTGKWTEEVRRPCRTKLPKINMRNKNRKRRESKNREGPREPSLVVRDGSVILKEVKPEQ